MLTIALCDDDTAFLKILYEKIYSFCSKSTDNNELFSSIQQFNCAEQVIDYLKQNTIDILFLDIEMPKMSGFDLAEYICKNYPDIIIIFTSAHNDFVYSSFEYSPFHFLRKNHLNKELTQTFEKAVEKVFSNQEILTFKTTEGDVLLKSKKISFIEGQKNYYIVKTIDNQTLKCRGTLTTIEKELDSSIFYRAQSSFILNFENIDSISRMSVKTKTGEVINISRPKYEDFKTKYMYFMRSRFL